MVLNLRRWGSPKPDAIVCVHGIAQHGGVFEPLGERLASRGRSVLAVDLRGHGESGREPPWSVASHVGDLLETIAACEVGSAIWIGHSFGGRVAATAAAEDAARSAGLVLLEPGLRVPPARALRGAEVDRLDWSFERPQGAVNALLGADGAIATPREVVEGFVRDDVRRGPDGRYRFSFSPSAAVTAWSELTLPPPPIAPLPTLVVQAEASLAAVDIERRYRAELGATLTLARVPNGHNVLWESPAETMAAIEDFLRGRAPEDDPVPGYVGAEGGFQPLI